MTVMKNRWLSKTLLAASLPLLAACSEVSYCWQCVAGHLDVMSRRRSIEAALQDPQVPEGERQQLAKALAIRTFAVDELGLPDNDSYRHYANLERPFVVWNVVATPEFSMTPKQWCYPVVGCVAYRGYFDQAAAGAMGEQLAAEGFDVDVYGVKAYSTLNWFDDPVLSTFLDGAESQLASLIFHELAHQVAYVPDDCAFNEAFAKTVEMEGLLRWLRGRSNGADWQKYLAQEARGDEFLTILRRARAQLVELYAQPRPVEAKRLAKREILAGLEVDLRSLSKQWPNPAPMDSWLERGLNNARLASIATYRERVPAFQGLLRAQQGDLPAFYAEVKRMAKLPAAERTARLQAYGEVEVSTACVVLPEEPR
jgi:predicted aminopeptidase